MFLLQRKFSSIHTITKSLTSAKTHSSELLAAELRTLYIQDNWGCCKYSAAQWMCTYTFPKWLYIIRLSAQQKRVRSFFFFLFSSFCLCHVARCVLKCQLALWFTALCVFCCVSGSVHVQHRIPVAAFFLQYNIQYTHIHTRLVTPSLPFAATTSSLPSRFQGTLREIQWCR